MANDLLDRSALRAYLNAFLVANPVPDADTNEVFIRGVVCGLLYHAAASSSMHPELATPGIIGDFALKLRREVEDTLILIMR